MKPRPKLLAAVMCLVLPLTALADGQRLVDSLDREYYLYTPGRIDPKKTYWLVVGVHVYGGTGQGAGGLANWVERGDCIVVGPSFPNEGYQGLEKQAGEQLVKLFEDLGKKYKLHPKLFLSGFSGGAQFAHRFMLAYPKLVAGCAAHSGGTWAIGKEWGDINPDAADIPLVISCGQMDGAKSFPQSPYSRVDFCRRFAELLQEKDFLFEAAYWPRTGHQFTRGAATMTEECYTLATKTWPQSQEMIESIGKTIEAGTLTESLDALRRARTSSPSSASILIQKAIAKHNKRLDDLLAQIDKLGLEKVKAVADNSALTTADAVKQLRQIVIDFRGAAKTVAAAQDAMRKLTMIKPKSPAKP